MWGKSQQDKNNLKLDNPAIFLVRTAGNKWNYKTFGF